MRRIAGPPQHVRHLVEIPEVVEQQTLVESVEHRPVLTRRSRRRRARPAEKLVTRQHVLAEGFRVFRHALRVEAAGGRRASSAAYDRGVEIGIAGIDRIEIDRAHVELEGGTHLLQVEAATSRADVWNGVSRNSIGTQSVHSPTFSTRSSSPIDDLRAHPPGHRGTP